MKKIIIVLVVAVLVVGGAGAYWFLYRDNDSNSSADVSSQDADGDAAQQFNPKITDNTDMIVTVSTQADGEKSETVIKYDSKGNSEYTAEQNSEEVRFVSTAEAYYMCNSTGCYKYANTQDQTGSQNPDQYSYSQSDIESYRSRAEYKGKEACGNDTCDVWQVSDYAGGASASIYIDSSTQRIEKITSDVNGSKTTITYSYNPVTIDIPTDAQELPSGI